MKYWKTKLLALYRAETEIYERFYKVSDLYLLVSIKNTQTGSRIRFIWGSRTSDSLILRHPYMKPPRKDIFRMSHFPG